MEKNWKVKDERSAELVNEIEQFRALIKILMKDKGKLCKEIQKLEELLKEMAESPERMLLSVVSGQKYMYLMCTSIHKENTFLLQMILKLTALMKTV